jgi:hypothetical protein
MSLPARLLLTKALRLLDRGELTRGEAALRQAATTTTTTDSVTAVVALCCLGELLIQRHRPAEAADALRSCLAVPLPEDLHDACAGERARARQLLAGLA